MEVKSASVTFRKALYSLHNKYSLHNIEVIRMLNFRRGSEVSRGDAGSLRRSWCCLELHYTILQEKAREGRGGDVFPWRFIG